MKNNITFKVTFLQQALMLSHCIGLIVFTFTFFYYAIGGIFFTFNLPFIITFSFLLVTSTLPTVIVHLQYLRENWKALLILDTDERIIEYSNLKIKLRYSFNDIESIEHNACYGGGSGRYSFGEYRYLKFTFKDGKEMFITCLMVKDIKKGVLESLVGINAEKRLKMVAFIY